MKDITYKIAYFFNYFPSFSLSPLFSSIFVQPRYFWLIFLVVLGLPRVKNNSVTRLAFYLIVLSTVIPPLAYFFGRSLSLLDFAMIINWVYLLFFSALVFNNISAFNKFMKFFLWGNIIYSGVQILIVNLGYAQFSMIHSNVPYHVEFGYEITAMYVSWLPRYSGFFIESGPLTLFLIISYLYIIQQKESFSGLLKFLVLLVILFSQSKFLLVFVPMFLLELFLIRMSSKIYDTLTRPVIVIFLSGLSLALASILFFTSDIHMIFSQNLAAYQLRIDDFLHSISKVYNLNFFGSMLQGTNYDASDGTVQIAGLDVVSILIFGYGVFFGVTILVLIFNYVLCSRISFKYTYLAILVLAFLASGSLLVPHYTFLIIFCYIIDQSTRQKLVTHKRTLIAQ